MASYLLLSSMPFPLYFVMAVWQPHNWDEDTRFDGPEHWGMEQRWKSLFPKSGVRVDDSSDSDSSSSRRRDSLEESDVDDIIRVKDTVDISKDDDDDDEDDDALGASSSEGDSHDATSLRIGVARNRENIRDTAPAPPDDERHRRISSSSRPSHGTNLGGSSGGGSSSSSKARREEAKATARRWRHGTKGTEPASSCSSRVGVGRRGEWGFELNEAC